MIAPVTTEAPLALPPLRRSQLANGLALVVAERRGLPLVSLRLQLAAGSAHEGLSKAGLAEFTAQLLRRGTRTRSASEIDQAIERVGGSLAIEAHPDSISLSASMPSEHLATGLEILADLAQNPRFAPSEVAAARARTLAWLANDLDEPASVADKAIGLYGLAGHPYGQPSTGFSRTVRTFNRADVAAFHARAFAPNSAALFVVGDLGGAGVEALVRKRFGRWARQDAPFPPVPELPAHHARQVIVVDKPDATQTQIRIGTLGIRRGDPATYVCAVAASVLGGGFTSRLMEEIRQNRGLSYGVHARFSSYLRGGEFGISTFTKNETAGETVNVALEVTRKLVEQGLRDEELARTKTFLKGLYPLELETHEQIARILADIHLYGLGDDHVSSLRDRIQAVTAEQFIEQARAHFPLDAFTLVCVGPARKLKKELAPFAPRVAVKKLQELE